MKVFHASNVIVDQPRIINRFKTLDFGEGFYTTENEDQARNFAVKVCERRSPKLVPVVNCYEFTGDLSRFSVLKFDVPDEKWLEFVVARRKGSPLQEKYDIIIGPVANDDVFGTIVLYEAGQLDKESAVRNFKVRKLYNQVVFCNEFVLNGLAFIESYQVRM
jgi:hypothetical protein